MAKFLKSPSHVVLQPLGIHQSLLERDRPDFSSPNRRRSGLSPRRGGGLLPWTVSSNIVKAMTKRMNAILIICSSSADSAFAGVIGSGSFLDLE